MSFFNFPRLRSGLYTFYKIYMRIIGVPLHLPYHLQGQKASDCIKELLLADTPCMVCRFGSLELQVIVAYLNVTRTRSPLKKLACFLKMEPLNFNKVLKGRFRHIAGFFPAEDKYMKRFAELMLNDSKLIDIVGVWRTEQSKIAEFFSQATNVPLDTLEAFKFDPPWTEALKGNKVLVIHPFDETIRKQYKKRRQLFVDKRVLPDFELKTFRAVQSAADSKVDFKTWFDALDYMCREIDKIDFDIALIGAGAYGFPLAAYVKSIGKKAVHMGGVSQLLFGIQGNRWDRQDYYQALYNDQWTRASEVETPKNCLKVEGGSYW